MPDYPSSFVDTKRTDFSNGDIEILTHDFTPLFDTLEAFLLTKNDTTLYQMLVKFGIDLGSFCGAISAQTASEGTYVEAVPLPNDFTPITTTRLAETLDEIMKKYILPIKLTTQISDMCGQLDIPIEQKQARIGH